LSGFDTITIGAMNIDIGGRSLGSLRLADSNPGKITHAPGGVGRNIAHNLALLGKKSALISAVGDDFYGKILLEQARAIGLDVSHCCIIENESSGAYLTLLDEMGEMVTAINDMAIIERITPDFLKSRLPLLKQASALIVDCNLCQDTLDFLLSQRNLPPIFVDGVSTFKIMKIKNHLGLIHTLKPNHLEASALSGMEIENTSDMVKVARWFHDQGLPRLVISHGHEGAYYSEQNGGMGWVEALKGSIVNVSGAGDACVAGLACGFIEGWDLRKSVCFGMSCASFTLESTATNNPVLSFTDVSHRMERAYENV